jgi:hypothetical protein
MPKEIHGIEIQPLLQCSGAMRQKGENIRLRGLSLVLFLFVFFLKRGACTERILSVRKTGQFPYNRFVPKDFFNSIFFDGSKTCYFSP